MRFSDRRPEWATVILQLADTTHRELKWWRLLGVTWKAIGFTIDEPLFSALRKHHEDVVAFASKLDGMFPAGIRNFAETPDETAITGEWHNLRLRNDELARRFWEEAERFAEERGSDASGFGAFQAEWK